MNNVELINEHEPTFLQKDNSRHGYVCPYCGNGTGKNGRGLEEKYYTDLGKKKWSCFGGCGGKTYDVVDLIKGYYKLSSDVEAINKGIQIYNIPNKASVTYRPQENNKKDKNEKTITDHSEYIKRCKNHNDFSYLKGRGISEETQERFNIGYDEAWRSPKALKEGKNPPSSRRCIIPFDDFHYEARTIDEEKDPRYKKMKEGEDFPIYNLSSLEIEREIFVTEGAIDCLSIEELGFNAIALGSVSNKDKLVEYLKVSDRKESLSLVLLLDSDDAGQKAANYLVEKMKEIGVACINGVIPKDKGKDPNDYLNRDRVGFSYFLLSLQKKAEDNMELPLNEYKATDVLDYFQNMEEQPDTFEAKTGFYCFDNMNKNLYGGLHEGLYILGAISSLGKTAFCIQLADQISENGNDVLFFSLEMSRKELVSRSLARYTYKIKNEEGRYNEDLARVSLEIINSRIWKFLKEYQKEHIRKAIEKYKDVAKNLYIYEGRYKGERIGVKEIKKITNEHYNRTGRKPVVFVDYLQILAPTDIKATDKQNTDTAVFELKELSRDLGIPVVAISSFNRDNYYEPVSMVSFKESGAIEYSSDVLFGLQYFGMDYDDQKDKGNNRALRIHDLKEENEKKQRERKPVKIQLKCLKNRNGNKFDYVFDLVNAYFYYNEVMETSQFIKMNEDRKPKYKGDINGEEYTTKNRMI